MGKCLKPKAKLNLLEEGKVILMLGEMESYYKDQIKTVNRNIKTLKQKHEDFKDSATIALRNLMAIEEDAFISIDAEKVKTSTERKQYITELDAKFNEVIIARKNKEKEMEQELIDFQESLNSHREQLKLLQYKLERVM